MLPDRHLLRRSKPAHAGFLPKLVQLLFYFLLTAPGSGAADGQAVRACEFNLANEVTRPDFPNVPRALPGPAFLLWLASRSWHHEPSFCFSRRRCRYRRCRLRLAHSDGPPNGEGQNLSLWSVTKNGDPHSSHVRIALPLSSPVV